MHGLTHILDHGTANPIVARLTVQIFAIVDHCEITPEARDGIKGVSNASSRKSCCGAGRSWSGTGSILRSRAPLKRPPPEAQIVEVPHVLRLEEECRNFLYEAKSFVRDVLKVFNLLYGTTFVEASEYLWAAKKGR